MKYLVMICAGHVPMYNKRINKDVKPFIKYFMPKHLPVNMGTAMPVVHRLHLAFKGMETEEVYAVLMEQLIQAIHGYDPNYTVKVKLVVDTINNGLSKQKQFNADRLREFEQLSQQVLIQRQRPALCDSEAGDRDGG